MKNLERMPRLLQQAHQPRDPQCRVRARTFERLRQQKPDAWTRRTRPAAWLLDDRAAAPQGVKHTLSTQLGERFADGLAADLESFRELPLARQSFVPGTARNLRAQRLRHLSGDRLEGDNGHGRVRNENVARMRLAIANVRPHDLFGFPRRPADRSWLNRSEWICCRGIALIPDD